MNALLTALDMIPATPGPSFFVWLRDERGFLDSYVTGGDWRHYTPAKLLELVKAAHPSRPVTWCDWAERPGDFTISGACLLVWCAGEKGTPIHVAEGRQKSSVEKYRKPKRLDLQHATALDVATHFLDQDWRDDSGLRGIVARDRRSGGAPAPAPLVEAGPKCGCGIGHTLASYRALPLVSASDRTEGFTKIHDEAHTCTCGAVLHFTSTRLVGG